MEKIITVIESAILHGAKGDYLLVTDRDGVKFSCFQEHKGLWESLSVNARTRITFDVVGKYKNIAEAVPVGEQIQIDGAKITGQSRTSSDHVNDARAFEDEERIRKQSIKPAPQELGMWWKELGECIRSGLIDKDFPNSKVKIKSQYYKQMEAVTGISMKKED